MTQTMTQIQFFKPWLKLKHKSAQIVSDWVICFTAGAVWMNTFPVQFGRPICAQKSQQYAGQQSLFRNCQDNLW